jgi:putative oxidoreductase
MTVLTKLNGLLATVGSFLRCPLLLVIRLYWGWQFFIDGKGKLQNLDKVSSYFASLNIPMPRLNAIMAGCTECGGGMLLLLGLFSRFVSPALIGVMCVAYATAEKDALHAIFSNPDKFLGADPFLSSLPR